MSVRKSIESPVVDSSLPKVRLISQPDFGHALRQAQLTIANLSGRVTQAELSEREARGLINVMRERLENLEGEVNELQEAESAEVQRLGSKCTHYFRENSKLIRELSIKDFQVKSMEKALMNAKPIEHADPSPEILSFNADSRELRPPSSLAAVSVDVPVKEIKPTTESKTESMFIEGIAIESKLSEDFEPGKDNLDLFERESSLLRDLHCSSHQSLMYPVDAVSDKEAKKWFPQAFQLVNVDLGSHYMKFLGHWIHFERLHGWRKSGGRLAGSGRPDIISTWVKEGRYLPRCSEPSIGIDGVEQYSREVCMWWKSMRPTTAFNQDNLGAEWVALNKHGINGWLSIVAGMKWWGNSLKCLTGDNLKSCTEEWIATL